MRRPFVLLSVLSVLLALAGIAPAGSVAQEAPPDEVREVAEDAYAFVSQGYVSFFVVTDEGVIATDPSSQQGPERAEAYAEAIASVTDEPVRYLVYSHNHADHATGGDVFAETATFVAHRNAVPKLAALDDPRVPVPTIAFDDFLRIELGGTTVELHHVGRNHSDNSVVMLLPEERVLFAVDFIPVESLPFQNLPDAYPEEWIESLRRVEDEFDFDILVIGHGPAVGSKENVGQVRAYLEDLIAAVRAAQDEGLEDNSPGMVEAVRAELEPEYGDLTNFEEWLPLNVEGLLAAASREDASPVAGTPAA